jgi:hypothetical protein
VRVRRDQATVIGGPERDGNWRAKVATCRHTHTEEQEEEEEKEEKEEKEEEKRSSRQSVPHDQVDCRTQRAKEKERRRRSTSQQEVLDNTDRRVHLFVRPIAVELRQLTRIVID